MPPRARGRGRGRADSRSSARTQRNDGLNAAYREMLREEAQAVSADENRARKRPKRAGERPKPRETGAADGGVVTKEPVEVKSEDEDDLEFEDVQIEEKHEDDRPGDEDGAREGMGSLALEDEELQVAVKRPEDLQTTPARARRKRKPVSASERSTRLAVHKMHVCYLLYHVFVRSSWCNDMVAQAILKDLIPEKTLFHLDHSQHVTEAQSHVFFKMGLNETVDLWRNRFRITAQGMRRPRWFAERAELSQFALEEDVEKPLELADFRRAASNLEGSADLGAQLFCCLLRGAGVEARLVCSLQVLGFTATSDTLGSSDNTPANGSGKKSVVWNDSAEDRSDDMKMDETTPMPRRIRKLGQTLNSTSKTAHRLPVPAKSIRLDPPPYPVFWVEAFNHGQGKWVAVDPLCTHTVNKPMRLEPGMNDFRNCMTYNIAVETSGAAKDVTRRYAKAFTAKTRRLRVESTDGGERWFRRAMAVFRRPGRALERDLAEEEELTKKEMNEGLPKNVQDFKGHPLYALERHLRRNEILHPKTEIGRINMGSAMNPRFETVYRRRDVHTVRSADKWFRLGREIKIGEQPLKHAATSSTRARDKITTPPLDPEVAEDIGVGLYAAFQTQVYVPPAVVNGRIPKNAYGTIDVYTPSMIPAGGAWIRFPEARAAARILGIEYVEAVTGFDFQGRHATKRVDGVVVAEEHLEAMEVTCEELRMARQEEGEEEKGREALRLWRRFLVGLREVARIEGYVGKYSDDADQSMNDARSETGHHTDAVDGCGGFLAAEGEDEPMPDQSTTRRTRSRQATNSGGFMADESDDSDGNGFLAEESDDDGFRTEGSGGGFVPDEDEDDDNDANEQDDEAIPSRNPSNGPTTKHDQEEDTSDNPFAFRNVRIPTSQSLLSSDHGRYTDDSLPRVIRGMRKPPSPSPIAAQISDEVAVNPVMVLVRSLQSPDPTVPQTASRVASTKPPEGRTRPPSTQQDKVGSGNNKIASEDFAEAHEAPQSEETPRATEPRRENVVVADEDDPPMSSYEYDDDMLMEDPEDEDAEPEWLA